MQFISEFVITVTDKSAYQSIKMEWIEACLIKIQENVEEYIG